jgi:maleate cis-trans isomerase
MIKKTKRFGLLLPSSNTTQEPEFAEVLPDDVSLHCARWTLRNIDPESTIKIVAELESEAGVVSAWSLQRFTNASQLWLNVTSCSGEDKV